MPEMPVSRRKWILIIQKPPGTAADTRPTARHLRQLLNNGYPFHHPESTTGAESRIKSGPEQAR